MKPTEEWDGHDRSGRLDRTAERGVLRESEVGAGAIVVVGVGPEDPAKMRLAQDHDMIQAFSPERADEPLDVSVLPGRSRRSWSVPNAHGSKTSHYHIAIRSISVPNEVLGCLIPGESLGDLASDPFGRRIGGDVDPNQVASLKADEPRSARPAPSSTASATSASRWARTAIRTRCATTTA
jgi:hypothetical protein